MQIKNSFSLYFYLKIKLFRCYIYPLVSFGKEYIITYGAFWGELSNTTTLTIKVKQKPCLKPYNFSNTDVPIFENANLIEEADTPSLVVRYLSNNPFYQITHVLFRVHLLYPLEIVANLMLGSLDSSEIIH